MRRTESSLNFSRAHCRFLVGRPRHARIVVPIRFARTGQGGDFRMTIQARLFGAIAASGVAALLAAVPAQALTSQECSAKYQAAKKDGTLSGMKWNDFRKAQCGAKATPAAAPAAAAPAPTAAAPAAPAAPKQAKKEAAPAAAPTQPANPTIYPN